jgi:hypothetical protein
MDITKQIAYLLGLITGRGHIFKESKFIAVEFSHANEFAEGIAHCPTCGWFATQKKGGAGDSLTCKNPLCGKAVSSNVKKIYNQPKSTVDSLNDVIIPFLKSLVGIKFEISGNKSMTLLIMDFSKNLELFNQIIKNFGSDTSFDAFHIPSVISTLEKHLKIEFVNGLLDTSGFPSPGGWLNRDGENGHGRMRAYFQIVRNWHLPVEIDNFLRSEFKLPIHTIDWGHPNIRDGNLEDYFNTRATSWSREHQVKFFPEYYQHFSFRISSKQALFNELIAHNLKTVFNTPDDWFPPSSFGKGKLKADHPGESDARIPIPARKHFDAFWQINFSMGCKFLQALSNTAKDPKVFYATGDINSTLNLAVLEQGYAIIRNTLFQTAKSKNIKARPSAPSKPRLKKRNLEADTYEPLVNFFKPYLSAKFGEKAEAFDTSSGNLNAFLKRSDSASLHAFDFCERFRIRPDVVGFLTESKQLVFVESKVTYLDLTALGQLIGYCMVGQPVNAVLISTQPISPIFLRTLKANPTLLNYGENKNIQIATLIGNNVKFEEI